MSTFGRVLGLSLAITVFSFGTAFAKETDKDAEKYARGGTYLMVSGAFLLDQSGSGLRIDTPDGWGAEATIGYRWSRHVAFELQGEVFYRDVGSSASDWMMPAVGPRLKYFILTDRFQPFVSIGMGLMRAEEVIDGTNKWGWGGLARFGVGHDFYLTENVVLDFTFEYLHGTGRWLKLRDLRFALGPQYRF